MFDESVDKARPGVASFNAMVPSVTVFVSYSHDSHEHVERIIDLATRLRRDGIDVELDQWVDSPSEGWPQWMERQIRKAQFVLIVCTETYNRRSRGEEREGRGRGARWEALLTYQHIYDEDGRNLRFIPVIFQAEQEAYIPTPLRGATYYFPATEDGYQKLYRRLTNQPSRIKPQLGEIKAMPPVGSSPVASNSAAAPATAAAQTAAPVVAAGRYTRPSLRELLMNVLVGDSDLEAFCIDYFPETKRLFSSGMDRPTKANLLLEREDNEQIIAALKECHPTRFHRFQSILRPTGG